MQKYKVVEIEVHVGGEDYLINLEGFYIDAMIAAGHPDIEAFLASKIEAQGGWLQDIPIDTQARYAVIQTLTES
jgi:hypothetical protein